MGPVSCQDGLPRRLGGWPRLDSTAIRTVFCWLRRSLSAVLSMGCGNSRGDLFKTPGMANMMQGQMRGMMNTSMHVPSICAPIRSVSPPELILICSRPIVSAGCGTKYDCLFQVSTLICLVDACEPCTLSRKAQVAEHFFWFEKRTCSYRFKHTLN